MKKNAMHVSLLCFALEYRINGGGGENNQGGWKLLDITIIGGLE